MTKHIARSLTVRALEVATCYVAAAPSRAPPVNLESPAFLVLTDLAKVRAAVINPDASIEDARQMMFEHGVRMLFVAAEPPCIDGMITAVDLYGDRPIRLLDSTGCKRFATLQVEQLMTPLEKIQGIEYESLQHATVGELAATFRQIKSTHLLVLEAATAQYPSRIRGLVSQSQLERQLGQMIDSVEFGA